MSSFVPRVYSPLPNVGHLTYGSAVAEFMPLGPSDATSLGLAGATSFLGFVNRAVVSAADHATALEKATMYGAEVQDRVGLPYKVGDTVSLVDVQEADVSGADRVVGSSTGAITSSTALGTQLSFNAGKFREVQSGETARYEIVAQLGNDADGDNTIRVRKL